METRYSGTEHTPGTHTLNGITKEVTYVPLLSCCVHAVKLSYLNMLMSWSADPWRRCDEYTNRCKHPGWDSILDNKLDKRDYYLILCVPLQEIMPEDAMNRKWVKTTDVFIPINVCMANSEHDS